MAIMNTMALVGVCLIFRNVSNVIKRVLSGVVQAFDCTSAVDKTNF